MPALRASSRREVLRLRLDLVGEAVKERGPVAGRDRPPRRERRLRRGDRGVHLLGAGARHLGHDLLGRGLDDREAHAATPWRARLGERAERRRRREPPPDAT